MIKETDALKMIIASYLNKEYTLSFDIDDVNMKGLYSLSNALNVTAIVGIVLRKNNIKNDYFEKSLLKSMMHYESLSHTYEKLSNDLSKRNINYLQLKGFTISKYYDYPFARYSSDIDLLVSKNDYDVVSDILIDDYGFVCYSHSIHEDSYTNYTGINIDLHKTFTFDNKKYDDVLTDCTFIDHELDNNYKYFHLIAHEIQHFNRGELNYRFFIDLFYLREHIDRNVVDSLLKKTDLVKIDYAFNSFLDSIIENRPFEGIDLDIENYILSYAKDKGINNRINISDNNKLSFLLKNIFPSFSIMKGKYPYLEDRPYLLIYAYFCRICNLAFGFRKKYVINTLKNIKKNKDNYSSSQIKIKLFS